MELPDGDNWREGTEQDVSIIRHCYCVNCEGGNGTTTMLPTKVPYFREIIIMSFACDDCYYRNTEINFGGTIQPRGATITLHLRNSRDLNRQVIKSDSATVRIPECYDFEIPPSTQRGNITTIEGLLRQAATNLEALQPERLKLGDIDNFHRCRKVIIKLRQLACVTDVDQTADDEDDDNIADESKKRSEDDGCSSFLPFTITVDDPAGNSYIENPFAPDVDPALSSTQYDRTPMQDCHLGLQPAVASIEAGTIDDTNPQHKNIVNAPPVPTQQQQQNQQHQQQGTSSVVTMDDNILAQRRNVVASTTTTNTVDDGTKIKDDHTNNNNYNGNKSIVIDSDNTDVGRKEVMMFATPCPHCFRSVETNMCVVDIPHFKEVIIMSLVCEHCGYKSNEIKGGGGIPRYGTEITLRVTTPDDLAREVLKSDTAGIAMPEIEFELGEGGLDGVYTTIEGLLQKMHQRLQSANPFSTGDSAVKHHTSNDGGAVFSEPSPNVARYRTFLQKLLDMSNGVTLPFTVIISDPLSNSFIGPVPKDAIALSYQAEKDGHNRCYNDYVDHGMIIKEYERSYEQNELLGLNDMKTENYQQQQQRQSNQIKSINEKQEQQEQHGYYGTDTMSEVPDRIRRIDMRGPDHPHQVGKAPVENDTTVMGPGSLNFAVPSIGQRGTKREDTTTTTSTSVETTTLSTATGEASSMKNDVVDDYSDKTIKQILHEAEMKDGMFMMDEEYGGSKDGMIFKDGAQGIGYYKDIPLLERWKSMMH